MASDYFEILRPFLKKAGKLAIDRQLEITGCNKWDGSIVTDTDLEISDLFQKFVAKNFGEQYVFDEERALKEKNVEAIVKASQYVWIIDPIDGTKTYFHGSNLFCIALSLYKDCKPVFGLIYLPSSSQIIYNDDDGAYYVANAFGRKECKTQLCFERKELNKNSLVYFPVKSAAKYIKDYKFTFIDGYSAYIYAFDVLKNIAQGAFLKDNISMWDVYSTLPIANKMGLKIYNIDNGEELLKLDFSLFRDNFKAKNIWLICHPCYRDGMFSIL